MITLAYFPALVPNRLQKAVARLHALIWRNETPLGVSATRPTAEHRALAEAKKSQLHKVMPGEAWGRLFDQRWCRITLPAKLPKHAYLRWRDHGEATLHLDGEVHAGLDVAHRHAPLPREAREAWMECYCCQSAIWHPDSVGLAPEGSRFEGAFLVERDEEAWAAYHDLSCLFDWVKAERVKQLPGAPVVLNGFGLQLTATKLDVAYRRMLRRLDEAVDAFDLHGVKALRSELAKIYVEFREAKPLATAVATGHAHLDLVWLWPEKMGEAKAVHTFATANRLMERYPEFRFAYSQSQSYAAVERRAPGLMRAVRRRLKSGQWQATGGLYVESDTMLPCGEALARSFIVGQDDFERLTGLPSRLLWLPDVFGYSGCLPQLCRLAGIDRFFTTKLTWNAVNAFPYSSFRWRGTDGSEVVAHVTQEVGYVNSMQVDEIQNAARGHQQSDVHDEFLLPTGFGDGGGGVTEEMCERARRLSALHGLPAVRWDQPEEFFARLEKLRPRLPVHQGECYLEYHRGTFTTHGDLKAAFRGLERALQAAEAAACLRGRGPVQAAAWRRLIFAQFHDYIPGSSVPEVYAEGIPELRRLALDATRETQATLETPQGDWCCFNPLPLMRREVVRHPERSGESLLVTLPPLAGVKLAAASTPPSGALAATPRELRSERVRARFDARGWLTGLAIDGRRVELRGPAAYLKTFSDIPANFEPWDIDRHTLTLGTIAEAKPEIAVETGDPARAVLAVARPVGQRSRAVVRYEVDAATPVLRITVELDWHEEHTLLKLILPTDYRGRDARCGQAFGTVPRSQLPSSRQAEAMWEIPASRHLTVMDDDGRHGLAVMTEAKYGFSVREGEVGVSLVRSPRITGYEEHGIIGYRRPLSRIQLPTAFTDQGKHEIRLALGAWNGDGPREENPAALAESLFTAPVVYRGAAGAAGLLGIAGGASLVPCWAKPEGGGAWTLRLHETIGARGSIRLKLAEGWRAEAVDLRGRKIGEARVKFNFRPHEILSLRLHPNGAATRTKGEKT